MDRNVNAEFKFNQESEFIPIAALIDSQLNATPGEGNKTEKTASSIQDNHHPAILALLASELSVAPEEIHDFELYVANDTLTLKRSLKNFFVHEQSPLRCPTLATRRLER